MDKLIFFDKQGRRRTDLDPIPLTSAGPAQRGAAAPASLQSRSTQQNQPQDQRGIQGGTRELGDVPQSEAPTSEERRIARRENRKDRVERNQSRRAGRIPTEEKDIIRRRAGGGEMPRAEAPTAEEVEEARTEDKKIERSGAMLEKRQRRQLLERDSRTMRLLSEGVNTITDEKSLGKADSSLETHQQTAHTTTSQRRKVSSEVLLKDIRDMYQTRVANLGYRADGVVINVPAVGNSGVTIEGRYRQCCWRFRRKD